MAAMLFSAPFMSTVTAESFLGFSLPSVVMLMLRMSRSFSPTFAISFADCVAVVAATSIGLERYSLTVATKPFFVFHDEVTPALNTTVNAPSAAVERITPSGPLV